MPGYTPKDTPTIDPEDSSEDSDSEDDSEDDLVFPVFKYMPQELQDMVWEFAIDNDPRVVEIIYDDRLGVGRTKWASKTLVPATMHTCWAARLRALRKYVILESFGDRRSYKETYIRWETDTVIFRTWEGLEQFISRHQDICGEEYRKTVDNKSSPWEERAHKWFHQIALCCRALAVCEDHNDRFWAVSGEAACVFLAAKRFVLVESSDKIIDGRTGNLVWGVLEASDRVDAIFDRAGALLRANARSNMENATRIIRCIGSVVRDSRALKGRRGRRG